MWNSILTRALVGFNYNATWWWGGGLFLVPPRISGTTEQIYKIQTAFNIPGKSVERKTNFIDLGVTDDVTGQVKGQMFHRSRMIYGMRYNIE